ncbi:MAG: hypothetical protein ABI472_18720 [Ginsengibacter sp.]
MNSKVFQMTENEKKSGLSRLMILSLVEAFAMQNHGIPYGPVDIRGSFAGLIKRELVTFEEINIKNYTQSHWRLTPKGISILKSLGVDVNF